METNCHALLEDDKAAFVKELEALIKKTREYFDIYRLDYVAEKGIELLYVTYNSCSQKRLNITGDSCSGIMKDFFRQVETADWLSDTVKEFMPE